MDNKLTTALIAAGAALLGAVLGAYVKRYAAQQKLKELQFEYEKRLQDKYLENAREYLNNVYVPISISLTKLNIAYQGYFSNVEVKASEDRLRKAIKSFLCEIDSLGEKGANAFLTTRLDETLQSFCQFIKASQTAEDSSIKAVARFDIFGSSLLGFLNMEHESVINGRMANKLQKLGGSSMNIAMPGLNFYLKYDEVMAAPLGSKEFEDRFTRDAHILNVLVKEVTLGSQAMGGGGSGRQD